MIPVRVLAVRYLANASPALCQALGAPQGYPALALLTTDCDDATYIALDEATKAADVQVCYGRSFYAGAANASTPYAGEVIGILGGSLIIEGIFSIPGVGSLYTAAITARGGSRSGHGERSMVASPGRANFQ